VLHHGHCQLPGRVLSECHRIAGAETPDVFPKLETVTGSPLLKSRSASGVSTFLANVLLALGGHGLGEVSGDGTSVSRQATIHPVPSLGGT